MFKFWNVLFLSLSHHFIDSSRLRSIRQGRNFEVKELLVKDNSSKIFYVHQQSDNAGRRIPSFSSFGRTGTLNDSALPAKHSSDSFVWLGIEARCISKASEHLLSFWNYFESHNQSMFDKPVVDAFMDGRNLYTDHMQDKYIRRLQCTRTQIERKIMDNNRQWTNTVLIF